MPLPYWQATTENDVEAKALYELEKSRSAFLSQETEAPG